MKVSIIIPVYNVEKYLPECLDSVLDQGWQLGEDYEVICVNDGSTDGSLAVLQRYEDKGIRVIDKPNCGVSSARNRGLDEARGEYVWMVDSDDFISPQMLPKVYEEASGKKLDVLFPRVAMTSEITPPRKHLLTLQGKASVSKNSPLNLVRRDFINQHHIRFNTHMQLGEDTLFVFHLQIHRPKTGYFPKGCCYYYRQRASSALHSHTHKQHYDNMQLLLNEYVNTYKAAEGDEDVDIEHIKGRIHRAVQVVVSDSLFCLSKKEQEQLLGELQGKGLYPFPIFWKLLNFKHGYKHFIINAFNLLLPCRWYYRTVSLAIRLMRKVR